MLISAYVGQITFVGRGLSVYLMTYVPASFPVPSKVDPINVAGLLPDGTVIKVQSPLAALILSEFKSSNPLLLQSGFAWPN